jgi:cupredoxin-like protein
VVPDLNGQGRESDHAADPVVENLGIKRAPIESSLVIIRADATSDITFKVAAVRKRETALDHTEMIEDFYRQGISRMHSILPFPVLIIALLTNLTALGADDQSFELSLKEHKFEPQELTIPADKRVKLAIKNLDSTPAEFESHNFKAEKVIPAGGEVSLYIGPLKGGTYGFFDDFHEDETKGTLIAK